jgi:hypothetical protein
MYLCTALYFYANGDWVDLFFVRDEKHGPFVYHFGDARHVVSGTYTQNSLYGNMTFTHSDGWTLGFTENDALPGVSASAHAAHIRNCALKLV